MAFSTITVGNQGVTSVNGLTGAVTLETGTDWQSTIQTSNFTAVAGKGYFVDTSSNTVTVSLPAGGVGDEIHFVDYASTFDTNEIIFDANGSEKIQGRSTNAKTTIENAELIKVSYNTLISTKIAFSNTIMELCHKLPNTNVDDVTNALKLANRRLISGSYMDGGMGDGGGCHPRDNIAMSYLSDKLNLSHNWFEHIMQQREKQKE